MNIQFNVDRLLDQFSAACTTNGQLMAEVEYLEGSNDDLRKENIALRDELSALKEEYKNSEDLKKWYGEQYSKYKYLYDNLTKEETK